ncbi:hypothetical protein KR222_003250 [Zaprionus bogoriensis]|nr:hypothetical protein KR222_003250 [Zaprionus bogoriensis]
MVKTSVLALVLLAGLALVAAMDVSMKLPRERSVSPAEYRELRKLQSLNLEFTQQFENITLQDLGIPDARAASIQDLKCAVDMSLMLTGIASGQLWALRMIDSWGSIPSGILTLNVLDLGNFNECVKISKAVSSSHTVNGKYCFAEMPFLGLLGINSSMIRSTALSIGICFPASCSPAHMDVLLNRVIARLITLENPVQLVNPDRCQTAEREPLGGLAIVTIVLLSIFAACAALATFCDYFICRDQANLPALVRIWSVRVNSRELFRIKDNLANPNVISCLHGMRCMSLVWVVYGHEYMLGMVLPNLNQYIILTVSFFFLRLRLQFRNVCLFQWFQSASANLIMHAMFSVDTFLFLSGLLVIMIALRSMERNNGKLNVPLMYLHRYLRLTPMVAMAILVYLSLMPLMADGPLSDRGFDDYSKCERTWFWDLLYVQNYATDDICLGHSWYLGVDMQLYLISPLFLFALYRWGKKAAYAMVLLIVLLTVWLFTIMMVEEYSMFYNSKSQGVLYFATHMHATPWLIGGVFGYFLHATRGKTYKLHWLWVWAGWLISLATMLASVFAMYPYEKLDGPKLSVLSDSLYYSLTRDGWCLALCWVVFACMQGYGGLADGFLSSPLWQPLSKLSYSAYIWHLLIQEINARRIQTHTFFTDYDMTLRFWGDFAYTVLVAYATYVTIEVPLGGLESMIFATKRPSPKPREVEPTVEITKKELPTRPHVQDVEAITTTTTSTTPIIESEVEVIADTPVKSAISDS